jgi:hypothetical protein
LQRLYIDNDLTPKIMFVKNLIFLACAFLLSSACSDSSSDVTPKTPEELIQFKWKVGTLSINGVPQSITDGNVDKIRITFAASGYTYVYPEPPYSTTATPGSMQTQTGTWRFNTEKTKVFLDRTAVGEPEFEWEILQLAPAIFRAQYQAPNPFNPSVLATYEFGYSLDL